MIICNYNYGRFLDEAIGSALQQTRASQVIVVDDGSTDDSRQLLTRIDPRVEIVLQENAGQLAAYNAGLRRATGEIVLFLDADDALEADAVERVGALFGVDVAKVQFRLQMVDDSGRPAGGQLPTALATGDVLSRLLHHGVLYSSPPGSGNAYRRAVLEQLFPLPVDPQDRVGADFFTIYGCVAFGGVASCGDALGRYRLHRKPEGGAEVEELFFGNAAMGNDEAAKVESRYARLVEWVAARTGGGVRYPDRFLDFSILKTAYATRVLGRSYWSAIMGSRESLSRLLRSLWLQPDFSLAKKVGLSAWSLLVLVAPRPTALRAARHVCNPASRGT